MCGIAGIVNLRKSEDFDSSVIKKMTCAMAHRGPDADGFFQDNQISLGHLRLSIIDLSESSNQPFVDYTGRFQLIFNGEIYNFREIKEQLNHYPFRTTGDTEVIIAAYATWGADCLNLLKGMYTFAIWDSINKELFVARDRMGVKPLYYYVNDNFLLFASEIRGIVATGFVDKALNHDAIRDFFYFQSIGHPHSIVENILQLEAGSYFTVRNGRIKITKYWDITESSEDFDFSNESQVRSRTRELLRNAVQRRLISDVPLGAFLSGGIDSSAIVGLMAEVSTARPNTFTVGFDEKEFDESSYADLIAKRFNTNHTRVLLQPAVFMEELTNALDAMDTPSGDGVNTYVVSKAIKRSGLTVALSGVGGDELFAGYPFFKQYLKLRKYKELWGPTRLARGVSAKMLSAASSNKMQRINEVLAASSCSIDLFYPQFRRIISPALLSRLTSLNGNPESALQAQLSEHRSSLEEFPDLSQVSIAEYLGYTQHTLLKDTDQMSMAVSLEVREPFFDHDLVKFVLSIPDQLKFPKYPKSFLVESLDGLLPTEIVHRRKQGFLFPWSVWMKNELKSFCEKYIRDTMKRDFIHGEELWKYWQKFLAGDRSVRWMEIWLFIILEYWLQKNGID